MDPGAALVRAPNSLDPQAVLAFVVIDVPAPVERQVLTVPPVGAGWNPIFLLVGAAPSGASSLAFGPGHGGLERYPPDQERAKGTNRY